MKKFLKLLVIVVVVLVALFFIVALFLPDESYVERSIVIDAPIETVYSEVHDYNNWEHWNSWQRQDLDAEYVISDPSYGIGATMKWKGDTVGTAEMERVAETEFTYIENSILFIEPMSGNWQDIWKFEEVDEGTKVTMIGKAPAEYPVGRYFGVMMDGFIGPAMEDGLGFMKNYLESLPEPEPMPADTTMTDEESMSMDAPNPANY